MPNPKKTRNQCLNCSEIVNSPAAKYCSNGCQSEHQYKQYIQAWKRGHVSGLIEAGVLSRHVRRYMLEKFGERCGECGWQKRHLLTGQVPLTIHHIDGNWQNSCEENLIPLCPNCHALTENFQNLNRGKGRTYRRRYEPRKNT